MKLDLNINSSQRTLGKCTDSLGLVCNLYEPPRLPDSSPTCVGRTQVPDGLPPEFPIHPHMRGEDSRRDRTILPISDSSPRAWGGPHGCRGVLGVERFIPTRMGRTMAQSSSPKPRPIHPHTHGEDCRSFGLLHVPCDSSPHAWGGLIRSYRAVESYRFIPIRMGRTPGRAPPFSIPFTMSLCPAAESLVPADSSPHAWGGLQPIRSTTSISRFIPTRMGRTVGQRGLAVRPAIHPHTHGEDFFHGTRRILRFDSSPHAWGGPNGAGTMTVDARFIPTRMGRTLLSIGLTSHFGRLVSFSSTVLAANSNTSKCFLSSTITRTGFIPISPPPA